MNECEVDLLAGANRKLHFLRTESRRLGEKTSSVSGEVGAAVTKVTEHFDAFQLGFAAYGRMP